MKLIFTGFIICLALNSCKEENNDKITELKNQLNQSNTTIQKLNDSISKLSNKNLFEVDVLEPFAFSNNKTFKQGVPFELIVGHYAYNSEKVQSIKFWIDDSTRNPENTLLYQGNQSIQIDPETILEFGDQALSNGNHIIYGQIKREENGIEKWGDWKFEYVVK